MQCSSYDNIRAETYDVLIYIDDAYIGKFLDEHLELILGWLENTQAKFLLTLWLNFGGFHANTSLGSTKEHLETVSTLLD